MGRQFKAIIVGGGAVGLWAAHAFSKAKIPFVVLERRRKVTSSKSLLSVYPSNFRVMDQLGLLESTREIGFQIPGKINFRPSGKELARALLNDRYKLNHGHPFTLFIRQELMDTLFDRLPERESRVMFNKRVVDIDVHDKGVLVRCEDGSRIEGSIVVGIDGTNSVVRRILRRSANEASPGSITDPEHPYTAEYRALYGEAPYIDEFSPNYFNEYRMPNAGMQLFPAKGSHAWVLYERHEYPVRERCRYSTQDAEAMATRHITQPLSAGKTFGDLWTTRRWWLMTDLFEGMVKRWWWHRIVLVGDSAHRMNPHAGLSANVGWQGAVALTNQLRRVLSKDADPATATLAEVFETYQRDREPMAAAFSNLSYEVTRIVAWETWQRWFQDVWLTPLRGGEEVLVDRIGSPLVRQGIVLDFLREAAFKEGRMPWTNRPLPADA